MGYLAECLAAQELRGGTGFREIAHCNGAGSREPLHMAAGFLPNLSEAWEDCLGVAKHAKHATIASGRINGGHPQL